jgi:diguanylate cyclase
LLLERCPHDVTMRVAENVRSAISAITLPRESRTFRIGASVGVAPLTEHLPDMAAWLAAADAACSAAKADGRGSMRAAMQPLLRVVGGRTLLDD